MDAQGSLAGAGEHRGVTVGRHPAGTGLMSFLCMFIVNLVLLVALSNAALWVAAHLATSSGD